MKKFLRWGLIAAIWLLIWEASARIVGQAILIPSPLATLSIWGAMVLDPQFWLAVVFSLGRILSGLLLGTLGGVMLAILGSLSPWWRDFFKPLLSIIRATPVASFIILALVWFSTGMVPVFATFLIVLPLIWSNVYHGIQETDPKLLEMAQAFRMNRSTRLFKLYIPSVRPYFSAAITTAIGMAWKAGVAAEIICIPSQSIGQGFYNSRIHLDTVSVFAWTVTVILLSILLEKLAVFFIGRYNRSTVGGKAI